MRCLVGSMLALAAALEVGASLAVAQHHEVTSEEVVTALEGAYGVHPGQRRTIGKPGDPEDDPTLAWPKERKESKVGTLTISSAIAQKGAGCENINYDPLVMGDGIAPTEDPVLLFRSPSYGVSYSKRLQGR